MTKLSKQLRTVSASDNAELEAAATGLGDWDREIMSAAASKVSAANTKTGALAASHWRPVGSSGATARLSLGGLTTTGASPLSGFKQTLMGQPKSRS